MREVSLGLTCGTCGKRIAECTCKDQDERLRQASDSDYVIFKWCRKCDKHYARCKCEVPDFGVRTGGVVHGPEYLEGMRNLDGNQVRIDPTIR